MKRIALVSALLLLAAGAARADYAVLRSGERLHITSYEQVGDIMRLTVPGGRVDMPASEIVSIEPEDNFQPNPAAPATVGPFADIIRAAAQKHGVDEALITCVIAEESNFNPRALSTKLAAGLMQLLPSTAARLAVRDVFDPVQNVDAGTRYLKELLNQYKGDLRLALAAYNAGPEVVAKYGGVPPYAETRKYVKHITARYAQAQAKSKPQSQFQP
jgi:soluble lytic murein transglycosylase-like protein